MNCALAPHRRSPRGAGRDKTVLLARCDAMHASRDYGVRTPAARSICSLPTTLDSLRLPNRIVMSPMTRLRAIDNVPNRARRRDTTRSAPTPGLISGRGHRAVAERLGLRSNPGGRLHRRASRGLAQRDQRRAHGRRSHLHPALDAHRPRRSRAITLPRRRSHRRAVRDRGAGLDAHRRRRDGPYPVPDAMSAAEDRRRSRRIRLRRALGVVAAGADGVELHGAGTATPIPRSSS